jgi:hypothetical protein
LAGATLNHLAHERMIPANLGQIGTVVVWITTLMLLIGMLYLVVNTWWIRRSLRKPPPPLDELLLPKLPGDTTIPGLEADETDAQPPAGSPGNA